MSYATKLCGMQGFYIEIETAQTGFLGHLPACERRLGTIFRIKSRFMVVQNKGGRVQSVPDCIYEGEHTA